MNEFQKTCLQLAKQAILEEFGQGDTQKIELKDPQFQEMRACFVTLKMDEELRGCIGSIVSHRRLADDIRENAKNAAFQDPRFSPLTAKEIAQHEITIGITILSPTQDKTFKTTSDLFQFLDKERCGLILKLDRRQATFLSSVWEELPNIQEFVENLLYKAGISMDEFETNFQNMEFQIYYGEEFIKTRKKI